MPLWMTVIAGDPPLLTQPDPSQSLCPSNFSSSMNPSMCSHDATSQGVESEPPLHPTPPRLRCSPDEHHCALTLLPCVSHSVPPAAVDRLTPRHPPNLSPLALPPVLTQQQQAGQICTLSSGKYRQHFTNKA
ncbi:unnamed protein product [Pleuronectes platessa]|uniref:Uncharacterized protein n=1 Tax=Pleuronectes platessa TaxID=8262 RepID=A0A9N7UDH1_PLEPL|nr:unnamed protein product [Pleuronectes platessa]